MHVYRIPELFSMLSNIFSRIDIQIEAEPGTNPFSAKMKFLIGVLERSMSDPATYDKQSP
jgi:hypothetical protein